MNQHDPQRPRDADWQRLMELLAPVYRQAAGFARRVAGSAADGDDVFQEAVLRAHAALPALRDPTRFRSWFFAILVSVHRNRARRSLWRRFLPIDAEPASAPDPAGEDGAAWEDERHRAARAAKALAGLPPEQREAIVLFEIEGFSIDEIAVIQKVTPSAVKSRLVRGRARLRRTYERWGFGRDRGAAHRAQVSDAWAPALAGGRPEEGRHD
jgi:RNA polymerase sigma-70 factor (ECF subfamily)